MGDPVSQWDSDSSTERACEYMTTSDYQAILDGRLPDLDQISARIRASVATLRVKGKGSDTEGKGKGKGSYTEGKGKGSDKGKDKGGDIEGNGKGNGDDMEGKGKDKGGDTKGKGKGGDTKGKGKGKGGDAEGPGTRWVSCFSGDVRFGRDSRSRSRSAMRRLRRGGGGAR